MKRCPSRKLTAGMHFFYLKNDVKTEQKNVKTRKIDITLKTAGNIA